MGGIEKKNVILAITVILAYAADVESKSSCKNAACPPYNGSSVIVPNPNECESFCVCTCDDAIYMPCPAGLQYNKECHMCDWPSHAGCEPIATSTADPETTPGTSMGCEMVKPFCPTDSDGNTTLLPNPVDCASYCICDWGNTIWFPCPKGYHFNPALKKCEPPEIAGCDPSYTQTPTTEDPYTSSSLPTNKPTPSHSSTTPRPGSGCDMVKPFCPTDGWDILPNPDDCESFCVCDGGNVIWKQCKKGLHFSPELKKCESPEIAGCDPSYTPKHTTGYTTDYTTTEIICNSTYYPSNPGSTIPDSTISDNGSSVPITPQTNSPSEPTQKPYPTDPSESCGKVKPLCPLTNNGEAILLPNPDDCGSYCACDWGNPIWMPCPPGLHFNPTLHICDYPEHAGCGTPSHSTPAAGTSSGSSTPGVGTTSGGDNPSGGSTSDGGQPGGSTTTRPPSPIGSCDKVKPLCPSTNEGEATLLPNPDDCGSYCVCDWGNPIWMPCPPGLHFNPTLKVCDYPEHAGCGTAPPPPHSTPSGGSTNSGVTTSSGGTPGGNTPSGGSTSDGGQPGGSTSTRPPSPTGSCDKVKPLCPSTNEGEATLLPNPDDCGSYCVCDWGNPIWMSCPPGLHFNPTLKVCDYPEHAGCGTAPPPPHSTPSGGSTNSGVTTSSGGTGGNPTSRPPKPTGSCEKVKPFCPPINEANATLIPNPDDCGSYCVCDWGNAIWMPCPAGLHFNPTLKVCDYPEHAGCISPPPSSAKPTPSPTTVTTSLGTSTSEPPSTKYSTTSKPTTEATTSTAAPSTTTTAGPTTTTTATPSTSSTAAPTTTSTAAPTTTTTAAPTTTTTAAPTTTSTASPTTTTAAPSTTIAAAPTTTMKPTTTKAPSTSHGIDGCHIVQPKCPVPENPNHATLLANPWDTHSYCKCDWGKVHWMPCSPGIAVFYEDLQACV